MVTSEHRGSPIHGVLVWTPPSPDPDFPTGDARQGLINWGFQGLEPATVLQQQRPRCRFPERGNTPSPAASQPDHPPPPPRLPGHQPKACLRHLDANGCTALNTSRETLTRRKPEEIHLYNPIQVSLLPASKAPCSDLCLSVNHRLPCSNAQPQRTSRAGWDWGPGGGIYPDSCLDVLVRADGWV